MHLPEFPELTPAMRSVLERMARAPRPPIHSVTPAQAKAGYEAGADLLEVPKARLARVEDFTIAARDGFAIPARRYADTEAARGTLVYFHGGGFVIGSIATHDTLCRELARQSGGEVVSVGYRLAPEHRFPVAVNDAWDAVQSLAKHATRIALGGDSAGGTLAAVCAILARDAGLEIALQLLFYPGTSATLDAPSHRRYGHGLVLEQEHIEWFFDRYVERAQRSDWRFAPLEASEVEGVAPAWIGLAECDPLFDDGIAYADKLRSAGVAVQLEVYRGVTHEFIKMGRALREARQAHTDAAAALASAFDTSQ